MIQVTEEDLLRFLNLSVDGKDWYFDSTETNIQRLRDQIKFLEDQRDLFKRFYSFQFVDHTIKDEKKDAPVVDEKIASKKWQDTYYPQLG